MCNEYNGWRNYPTWCVSLWINNTEADYTYWREAALQEMNRHNGDMEQAASSLADRMRDELTEAAPDLGATLFGDMLTWALSMVEWYDVAKPWMED